MQLTDHMKSLTLDIIGDTAFGYDFKAQTAKPDPAVASYVQAFDAVGMTWMSMLGTMLPLCVRLEFLVI